MSKEENRVPPQKKTTSWEESGKPISLLKQAPKDKFQIECHIRVQRGRQVSQGEGNTRTGLGDLKGCFGLFYIESQGEERAGKTRGATVWGVVPIQEETAKK